MLERQTSTIEQENAQTYQRINELETHLASLDLENQELQLKEVLHPISIPIFYYLTFLERTTVKSKAKAHEKRGSRSNGANRPIF